MELNGFLVSVHSDGEQLKEYAVEVSPDRKKITCWIPSQAGKKFEVKCMDGESSTIQGRPKSLHVFLDGRRMEKCACLPDDTRATISGVQTAEKTRRPFVFADILTTDGDEDTMPENGHVNPDEIGAISLKVFLVVGEYRHSSRSGRYEVQDHPPAAVDERKKKAGQHCISLGDQEPCRETSRYTGNYDSNNPDLVFEFRYRPLAILQALGIAPSSKREAPLIIDLDDEDDQPPPKRQKKTHGKDPTQAELEQLRNRVRELEGNAAGPSVVKKEGTKFEPGEIIDLT